MTKKDTKNYYLDEDILLLMLNVLDNSVSKNLFTFNEFKAIKFKRIGNKEILEWLIEFAKNNKLSPTDLEFDGQKTWDDYEGDKFDKLLSYMNERPGLPDQIRRILNFKIKVNKAARNKLSNVLKKYINFFINGKLDFREKRYLSFLRHKEKFMEIIEKYLERIDKALIINDSDFGTEYRFIECILALETQYYFKYESIKFKENCYEATILPKAKLIRELRGGNHKLKIESEPLRTIKVPPGTVWENVAIKFLNEHDVHVQIKKGENYPFDFNDFKCINMKNGSPDKQWELFHEIAKFDGKLIIDRDPDEKVREKYRQRKMILTERLREFFKLKDDPFRRDFERHGIYYPKFKLLPTPSMRVIEPYGVKDERFSDQEEVYKDTAVEIYTN